MGRARVKWGVALCVALLGAAARAGNGTAELSRGPLHVEYAPGDEALARESLEILDKAVAEFGAHLPAGNDPIRVTICPTIEVFRQFAGKYGMARVGGIAKSPQGVIVVKAPYLLPSGQDYRGMLRHELIHVLLARNTEEAYVPRWVDEGVAMVVSQELRWESSLRIARMYVRKRIIPYNELNFAFAPIGDEGVFGDAYAEALSMTRYVIDRIGEERFWELVRSMKTISFEEALHNEAGLTPGALYDGWRRSLWKVALLASLVSGFSAFQLMAILLVLAYLRKQRRGRKLVRQWEEEEDGPEVFSWDKLEEGPYPWEEEYDDEDERR